MRIKTQLWCKIIRIKIELWCTIIRIKYSYDTQSVLYQHCYVKAVTLSKNDELHYFIDLHKCFLTFFFVAYDTWMVHLNDFSTKLIRVINHVALHDFFIDQFFLFIVMSNLVVIMQKHNSKHNELLYLKVRPCMMIMYITRFVKKSLKIDLQNSDKLSILSNLLYDKHNCILLWFVIFQLLKS